MLSLAKLSKLAKDNSTGGRKSLISALTDLFVSAENEQAEQISLIFGDIVMRVLGQLEAEARQTLARRVCAHAAAPHDLMVELAKDEIEVAQPVLETSPVLTAEDLARIASTESMEHMSAIAGRENVEEVVTRVIVSRGDNEILTKVAENQGAHFDESAFMRLVDRSRQYPAIQEALINRQDLPSDAARMLVPFLSSELAERVKSLGADSTLVQVMAERAAEEVASRARKVAEAKEQADKLIKDVKSGKAKLDDAVQMFARGDRAAELGILLAKMSDLPSASVSNLIYGKSDKPLVIICKACGVGQEAYKSILTMRARQLGMSGPALNDSLQRYAKFAESAAKRSLMEIRASVAEATKPKESPDQMTSKIAFGVKR
jgi:uncharacterized protein (DUF2336 family)